jgi:hypothetical protein
MPGKTANNASACRDALAARRFYVVTATAANRCLAYVHATVFVRTHTAASPFPAYVLATAFARILTAASRCHACRVRRYCVSPFAADAVAGNRKNLRIVMLQAHSVYRFGVFGVIIYYPADGTRLVPATFIFLPAVWSPAG